MVPQAPCRATRTRLRSVAAADGPCGFWDLRSLFHPPPEPRRPHSHSLQGPLHSDGKSATGGRPVLPNLAAAPTNLVRPLDPRTAGATRIGRPEEHPHPVDDSRGRAKSRRNPRPTLSRSDLRHLPNSPGPEIPYAGNARSGPDPFNPIVSGNGRLAFLSRFVAPHPAMQRSPTAATVFTRRPDSGHARATSRPTGSSRESELVANELLAPEARRQGSRRRLHVALAMAAVRFRPE